MDYCPNILLICTDQQRFDTICPLGNPQIRTPNLDRQHKLVVYHGTGLGELLDLNRDRWEHQNLWDDWASTTVRGRLLQQAFDSLAEAVDLGLAVIGAYWPMGRLASRRLNTYE